jgi:hypothetical protein
MEIYYTYAWIREDRTPYYIGKGHGNRAYDQGRAFCPPPDRVLILKRNLSEVDAFKHEVYMIAVYGRKDLGTGILHNRTDGGDGVSGLKWSEESRQNVTGELSPRFGVPHTEETLQKMSQSKCGDRNNMFGKTHGPETLLLLKEQKLGSKWWVNFTGETKHCQESPGPEWQLGRKWKG